MAKEQKELRKQLITVIGFEVPKSEKEKIRSAAKAREMSVSALCRTAVREYLAKP